MLERPAEAAGLVLVAGFDDEHDGADLEQRRADEGQHAPVYGVEPGDGELFAVLRQPVAEPGADEERAADGE